MAERPALALFYSGLFAIGVALLIPAFYFNDTLFGYLNCRREAVWSNYFFLLLTSLADGFWVMMLVTVIQSIAPRNFTAFVLALLLGNAVLQPAKILFAAERPLRALGESVVCVVGMPLQLHSFPSGHAFSSALFFMYARPQKSLAKAITLFAITALAAFSRIYIGAHFPRDVVVGFLWGVVVFLIAEKISLYLQSAKVPLSWRRFLLWLTGMTTVSLYLFFYEEKTRELEFLLTPLAWLVLIYWLYYAAFVLWRRKPAVFFAERQTTTRW